MFATAGLYIIVNKYISLGPRLVTVAANMDSGGENVADGKL